MSLYHAVTAELISRFIPKFSWKNITYITINKILLEMIDSWCFGIINYSSLVSFKLCKETLTYRTISLLFMVRRWVLPI